MERSIQPSQSTLLVVLFGVVSGFSFGFNQGIISVAKAFVLAEFGIKEETPLDGLVVASLLVGGMIGSLGGGIFMNRYGRRVANLIGCGLSIFGLASALAPDIYIFLVLRVFLGAGLGLTAVVCPAYVSDMAEASMKATLGVIFQIFITVGIFVSFLVGWGLSVDIFVLDPTFRWRIMIGVGVLCPIALGALTWVYMLPESSSVDMGEEARMMLNGTHEGNTKPGIVNMIIGYPKEMLTGLVLAATLQLTGINAVMFYGPNILKKGGFTDGNLLNLGIGGWNFITTLVAVALVKRMGRKILMIVGTALMTAALIGIGLTFTFTHEADCMPNATSLCPRAIGVTAGLGVFLLGFESGPGCLFWVLANEIFSKAYNELGASYINVAQWGFNLLVSFTFPLINPPLIAFYTFGGVGAVCTVYLLLALKEPTRVQTVN